MKTLQFIQSRLFRFRRRQRQFAEPCRDLSQEIEIFESINSHGKGFEFFPGPPNVRCRWPYADNPPKNGAGFSVGSEMTGRIPDGSKNHTPVSLPQGD